MTDTAPPTIEIYASAPGGARWDTALWGTDVWSTAGWQDVTPQSVTGSINWGIRNPETGILATPDADTWALTLHDPARLLDPGNPAAAYAGDLHAGLPIRVSHRGLVVRTGVVESIGHHFVNHGGYIRATSSQALMVRGTVPAGTTMPDTLYARARACIAAAGLNILVYGIGKPGLWDDPPLLPLVLADDRSVWGIVTEGALGALQLPFIDRTGNLRFRAWDTPIDRGTTLTTAEMVDLSVISTDADRYSRVQCLEATGPNYQTRAVTPPPDYGVVTYRRNVPTIDAAGWAGTVLADRSTPGARWVPGSIFCDDAERLETLLTTDMLERVGIDADTPLTGAMLALGGEVTMSGGTTNKGRWGVNLKGKHQPVGSALGGVQAIQITNTTAVISWVTSTPGTSRVNYGTTAAYGSNTTLDSTLVTTHLQNLTGLTPATNYHFRVRSTDAANAELISGDYTFTTLASGTDVTPPVISNLTALVLSTTSVQVCWDLDEFATGQVEWGTTVGLGNFTTPELSYVYQHHAQSFTVPAGIIYYRVISGDASGNIATSTPIQTVNTTPSTPAGIYGLGIQMDSLNNKRCDNRSVSQRFKAVTNTTVTKVVWEARKGSGYSAGTGGTMEISIQTDDGTTQHRPSGTKVGTVNYTPGNSGTGGFVSVTFSPAAPITGGQLYHVVWRNLDSSPTANYISVNICFVWTARVPRQPAFTDLEQAVLYQSTPGVWFTEANETVNMDVTTAAGQHIGSNAIGAMLNNSSSINGTTSMVREVFTVTGGNRTVVSCYVRIGRQSGSGLLTIRLEDNSGTLIESGTVDPASVPNWTPANDTTPNGGWVGITFTTPRTLVNGQTYRLRLSTDGASTYSMTSIRRSQSSDGADYLQSRGFYDGQSYYTTNSGSSWAQPYAFAPQNMQMYFETTT